MAPDARRVTGAAGEDAVADWYAAARLRRRRPQLARARGRARRRRRAARRMVVFCEVKTRRGDGFGPPVEAVTAKKQQRLRLLAGCWLDGARRAGGGPALRRRVRDAGRRRRLDDRRARSRVLKRRRRCYRRLRPVRRRCSDRQQPVCQCRRSLGSRVRHHDLVALAGADLVVAARAAVRLHGLVRLDVAHVFAVVGRRRGRSSRARAHRGNAAHATSSATIASAATTIRMSLRRLTCLPNGLKPMPPR